MFDKKEKNINSNETLQLKEFNHLNEIVKQNIVHRAGNEELRKAHTQMLINCSAGDKAAKEYVKDLIKKELEILGYPNRQDLIDDIYSKNWGLGPIDKYDVDDVDEIMVQGTRIHIQKDGKLIEVPERMVDYAETIAIIRRTLEFDRRQDINEQNCIVLAERMDGSRITATIPPVAKMPYLNIRKFDSFLPTTENLIAAKTITPNMVDILRVLVEGRANIIVIGEMGAGKTTFMKWLLGYVSDELNVGTMETTFELNLDKLYPNKKWIQLCEYGNYHMQDLFAVMLRQNVDIMLVGESRSYEVNELIKAMSRGHSGSIGTAHSIGAEEVVDDFADMILESGKSVNLDALKYKIARAIDIVIKFRKLPSNDTDKRRRRVCGGIYEIVTDKKTLDYHAVPIVEFDIDDENPKSEGAHVLKNPISDTLKHKLKEYGIPLSRTEAVFSPDLFENTKS